MKLRRLALPLAGAAAAVLVAGGLWSYSQKRKAPAPAATAPLELQFYGCARVDRGPVCVVKPKQKLTLFVESRSTTVEITSNSGPAKVVERVLVDTGARYVIELPEGAERVRVVDGNKARELPLENANEAPLLREARQLRESGKPEQAERVLRDGMAALTPVEQGRSRALLGRILIARGEREKGRELLEAALQASERTNRVSETVEDVLVLAFGNIFYDQNFANARQLLARARQLAPEASAPEIARAAYFEGLLAEATGDRGTALDRFRDANVTCNRFSIHPLAELVTRQIGLNLAVLGRTEEATLLLRGTFPATDSDTACNRVGAHADFAWILHLGHRENPPAAVRNEAREHLARARQLLATSCQDPIRKLDASLTGAEWALASDDDQGLARDLATAASIDAQRAGRLVLWRLDLEARRKLAKDDGAALVLFQREASLADAGLDIEAHWRSQIGVGNAFEQMGRTRDAIRAYEASERDLDRLLLMVPLAEGRDAFAGAMDRGARRLVALLVRQRRAGEAFAVARRARVRALSAAAQVRRLSTLSDSERRRWDMALGKYQRDRTALEAESQNDWRLPSDELAAVRNRRSGVEAKLRSSLDEAYRLIATTESKHAPAEARAGEIVLAYFPVESGFIGFAASEREILAKELGAADQNAAKDALSNLLLGPFSSALREATRVRVLAYGSLRHLDFHALPFEGLPLGHRASVEYALDLGAPPSLHRTGALVVVDPKTDLPRAFVEGRDLERDLRSRRVSPFALLSGDSARRGPVLDGMARVRWFHFAGHGSFAGPGGTDSALELNDGRITLGDVLALSRVPELVVLNACEAARTSERVAPESFGLAQAFLVRGADAVIAPARPIRDELASAVSQALYREMTGSVDAATALGRATRSIAAKDPKADWAAFRALSP